ncbi:hypothetical protein GUU_01752 [Malacoplasma iowae 695]|nr:hypothetical protein GUU_01752 [Malacoplasma iowae 695]
MFFVQNNFCNKNKNYYENDLLNLIIAFSFLILILEIIFKWIY